MKGLLGGGISVNGFLIKNDLKRNKLMNGTLFFFILLAVTLASSSIMVALHSFNSISELYAKAQPPHFLQMHKGDMDDGELVAFMEGHEDVENWQVQSMLSLYGDNLRVERDNQTISLADSALDIGLVKQNTQADFLLDSQHNLVELKEGQVGMSNLLFQQYDLAIGDRLVIELEGHTESFIISELIIDAQMNSSMTSSTRILLSDPDFERLVEDFDQVEYLIEAYFADSSLSTAFQTAYENAGLPNNGPAITYAMIFLLSALTDLLVVFILLLVSFFLMAISFLCLRFTLLATLEEEVHEIGAMKAIGLSYKDIRDIYLVKYRFLAALASLLAFFLALFLSRLLTSHLATHLGKLSIQASTYLAGALTAFLVYFLMIVYVRRILSRIKEATVIDTLVRGTAFQTEKKLSRPGQMPRHWPLSLRLSFSDFVYQLREWKLIVTIPLVLVLMLSLPISLVNTMQSRDFVTYMGSAPQDILIEIDSGGQLKENYQAVKSLLDQDLAIESYSESKRVSLQTLDAQAQWANIHIDSGGQSGRGLQYLEGQAPKNSQQISLSLLNADKFGLDLGDTMTLVGNQKATDFQIVGIYQDVTNGGYTAKAINSFDSLPAKHYQFTVSLTDSSQAEAKAEAWSQVLDAGVSIAPMEDFIDQSLGGVVGQIESLIDLIIGIAVFLLALIVILFLYLRLTQDKEEIAIQRAIGFTVKDLRRQYYLKLGLAALVGAYLGAILGLFINNYAINAVLAISGLGIQEINLLVNPLTQFVILPGSLLLLLFIFAFLNLRRINRQPIISLIRS